MKPAKTALPVINPAEPAIRIVKIASCPSLSGKSTLKYNVGCTADATIYFRVFENSGGGFFSHEWIPLGAIQSALAKASSSKALTSFLLYPLFSGRSQNSPGFLLAAIKAEGLVQPSTAKRRCYESMDDSVLLAEVQAWMASGEGPKREINPAKGGASSKGHSKARSKGKTAKAIGHVPATVSKKDAPAKVTVAVPLPVMADIVPTVQQGSSQASPGRPAKKKAQ